MARTIAPLTGERGNLETPALILELDARDRNIVVKLTNSRPFLRYRVAQAHWGNLQQVMSFAERARQVGIQIERIRAVVAALRAEGVGPDIVTGRGTDEVVDMWPIRARY